MRRALVLMLVSASPASADDARPPVTGPLAPVTDNFPEPILLNIPAMSSGLVIDVRLDRTDYTDESDPNVIALVPSVQYITATAFGGWLTLPAPMVESYSEGNGATQKHLGGASLGGVYAYRGTLDVTARLGLGVPLSNDLSVPRAAAPTRPTDFATQDGDALWFHAQLAAQLTRGLFSVGATAIADLPMFAHVDEFDTDSDKSIALAASAGLHHERVGGSLSVAYHEPLGGSRGFQTFDAAVDVVVSHTARAFLAYGLTSFGSDAYSIGAGLRFWR